MTKMYALKFVKVSDEFPKYLHDAVSSKLGELVRFYTSSNDGQDMCTDVSYILDTYGSQIWVTTCKETAERVAWTDTEYYNANFDTPQNKFVGCLAVVELVILKY
jgi:hypothetical protein